MKKTLGWILIIMIIIAISILYHNSFKDNEEDWLVDDVDLDGIVESEIVTTDKEIDGDLMQNNVNIDDDAIDDNLVNDEAQEVEDEKDIDNTETETKIDTKIETISGAYSSLSNTKNAWGFVRKPEGKQPEFYGPYTKVLDKYEGIYCGNNDEKFIYLTFDEGYENGYTTTILDTLKEKNVTAVFFVTMPYVKQNPELIQRMLDEGHIVGNHTVNHPSMPEVTDDAKLIDEIMNLHNYILDNYNYEMTYLRPPKGEYSERTVKLALDLGYKTVLWSSAYDDWNTANQKGTDYAKKMIYNNLHNGSVMLLHAVSKDNDAVLGEAIDEVRNRGYEFKTLDEFER